MLSGFELYPRWVPLSVSLLYLGQTALMLEYLVLRECRLLFKIKLKVQN